MTKSDVRLSGFSLVVLDSAYTSRHWPAEETVERALEFYLADRNLRPPGWACLSLPAVGDEAAETIDIEVSKPLLTEIAAEAMAQEVATEALVSHAVMYLWTAERREHEAASPTSSHRGRVS